MHYPQLNDTTKSRDAVPVIPLFEKIESPIFKPLLQSLTQSLDVAETDPLVRISLVYGLVKSVIPRRVACISLSGNSNVAITS